MKRCCTFLGEKTPRVPPSSRMATPISASSASLRGGKENIRPMLNDIAFDTLAVSNKTDGKYFLNIWMCMLVLRSVCYVRFDRCLSLVQTDTSLALGHIADTPHGHYGYGRRDNRKGARWHINPYWPLHTDGLSLPQLLLPGLIQLGYDLLWLLRDGRKRGIFQRKFMLWDIKQALKSLNIAGTNIDRLYT